MVSGVPEPGSVWLVLAGLFLTWRASRSVLVKDDRRALPFQSVEGRKS
jgi:hypothetical protein